MTARIQGAAGMDKPVPRSRAKGNSLGCGGGDVVRYRVTFITYLLNLLHLFGFVSFQPNIG